MALNLTYSGMREKLGQVFPPEQADVLVDIFGEIRQIELNHAADTRDLKQGLRDLTAEVKNLAVAQRHTDERITKFEERTEERFQRTDERIAKFEERTEERFQHIDERFQHTDERIAKFEERTEERFQRTDEHLAELGRAVQLLAETVHTGLADLRQAVGALANRFGFDLEEFVAALLPPYIARHGGITELTLARHYFEMEDGQQEEVDLFGSGQRDGRAVTVLAECRTTIGGGEMRRLAAKLECVADTLPEDVVKIVVAMNLHPTALEAARETGVWAIPYSRINRERD
jgi:hypothetical protein